MLTALLCLSVKQLRCIAVSKFQFVELISILLLLTLTSLLLRLVTFTQRKANLYDWLFVFIEGASDLFSSWFRYFIMAITIDAIDKRSPIAEP